MRILFVAETSSIHTARWINQLKDTGWDIHVFQGAAPGSDVCPDFKCGTLYLPSYARVPEGIASKLTWLSNVPVRISGSRLTPLKKILGMGHVLSLTRLIRHLKPDVVHSLGMNVNWNNICLPVLRARRLLSRNFKAPWLYSSWGSDLDYYARQSVRHRAEVEGVLRACDYHVAECERDSRLAREMGFWGESLGFLPAFGGIDWEELQSLRLLRPASSRKTIMLKGRGREDRVGRAMTAMKAFALCQDVLSDFRIVIQQASPSIVNEAKILSMRSSLNIQILPYLPYRILLENMGASRLMLALTINDGLPSTLVESMSLGALPIHSDLEPIREWVRDGENGLLVPPEDSLAVAGALRRGLGDGDLVDRAAEKNAQIVRERLADTVVRPKVIGMYNQIVKQGPVLQRH